MTTDAVKKDRKFKANILGFSDLTTREEALNDALVAISKTLEDLHSQEDYLTASLHSLDLLVEGLKELRQMVEMVEIKETILNQIKFYILHRNFTLTDRSSVYLDTVSNATEGHMFHAVLSGQPGTGKTTVAQILAKIWVGLGLVKRKRTVDLTDFTFRSYKDVTNQTKEMTEPNELRSIYNHVIDRMFNQLDLLKSRNHRIVDNLREVDAKVDRCRCLNRQISKKLTRGSSRKNLTSSVKRKVLPLETYEALCEETGVMTGLIDQIGQTLEENPAFSNQNSTFSPRNSGLRVTNHLTVAKREDLIGEYVGHTAVKTNKVLQAARGGVLFIDEAYNLCNGKRGNTDSFGLECLTAINEFMSLYPTEIIVIFGGYKDKLEGSLFRVQPGLRRRIAWFFEITGYSTDGLTRIFMKQIRGNGWLFPSTLKPYIRDLIEKNKAAFPDGGGSTEKLSLLIKMAYADQKFADLVKTKELKDRKNLDDRVIEKPILDRALQKYLESNDQLKEEDPPLGMYS